MERRRPAPRARLVATIASLAVVVSACGGTGPIGSSAEVAATVDDHDITFDEVKDLIDAQQRFYRQSREEAGDDEAAVAQIDALLSDVRGTGAGTLGTAGFAAALQQLITYQVVVDELSANGVELTDADRQAARAAIAEQVGGEDALAELDDEFVDATVRSQAADTALTELLASKVPAAEAPTEDDLRALWEQTRAGQPICLDVILSTDQAGADAAEARLDAGEDFATVASEESADPASAANGGFAGCGPAEAAAENFPGDYVDPVVGEVFGPEESTGGFLTVRISSTSGPTFEQARPALEQQIAAEAPVPADSTQRVQEILAEADVTIGARYGRWDAETGTVVVPDDPSADDPSADPSADPSSADDPAAGPTAGETVPVDGSAPAGP